MKTLLLALALTATGLAPALAATDAELRAEIVGKWGLDQACDNFLIFNEDGTFSDGEGGGTYAIEDGMLSGQSANGAMPVMAVSFEDGMLVLTGSGGRAEKASRCDN